MEMGARGNRLRLAVGDAAGSGAAKMQLKRFAIPAGSSSSSSSSRAHVACSAQGEVGALTVNQRWYCF